MGKKLRFYMWLKAYQETGNPKFLARARKLIEGVKTKKALR